ncbi:MAG: oxygen-independent coproporphyrinogen III oxidase [Proteobacteria bacterium]|nr:MAG: oxygen-independent coproporphyrinogen III oxidase [Pseudomonadota bacterium]
MDTLPELTPDLLIAYDRPGPRYTSYPTADRFNADFDVAAYEDVLRCANAERPGDPLSVYIHLPFCESLCTYCGCNVVISKSERSRARYLERLALEMARVAALLPDRREVVQLHLGGGTPNSFSDEELATMMASLLTHFHLAQGAEVAIEVDPRHATVARLEHLYRLGFNRLSMGVQDFDPRVQASVNRICSFRQVKSLVDGARALGFRSVNLDLIYGLPFQGLQAFQRTKAKVLALRPDRIALYSFAWIPWVRPQQKKIDPETLPSRDEKVAIFCDARATFEADYHAIGMDHFALPGDELSLAQTAGTLRRNFQGYTTLPVQDVLGFGVSAIGDIGGAYAANAKRLHAWNRAIDAGGLAVERGVKATPDDRVRRYIIHELMCNLRLDHAALRERLGVDFEAYFAEELRILRETKELAPLIRLADGALELTPLGRLFVRNVATVFDRHLRDKRADRPMYSRMV